MAAALAVIGLVLLWRRSGLFWVFFAASASFAAMSVIALGLLKPLQIMWMTLAVILGFLMTRIILVLLFYLVLTPIALIMRLFGKQFLSLRFKKDPSATYWLPRPPREFARSDYDRQF